MPLRVRILLNLFLLLLFNQIYFYGIRCQKKNNLQYLIVDDETNTWKI